MVFYRFFGFFCALLLSFPALGFVSAESYFQGLGASGGIKPGVLVIEKAEVDSSREDNMDFVITCLEEVPYDMGTQASQLCLEKYKDIFASSEEASFLAAMKKLAYTYLVSSTYFVKQGMSHPNWNERASQALLETVSHMHQHFVKNEIYLEEQSYSLIVGFSIAEMIEEINDECALLCPEKISMKRALISHHEFWESIESTTEEIFSLKGFLNSYEVYWGGDFQSLGNIFFSLEDGSELFTKAASDFEAQYNWDKFLLAIKDYAEFLMYYDWGNLESQEKEMQKSWGHFQSFYKSVYPTQ